jgi:hypothetical protein
MPLQATEVSLARERWALAPQGYSTPHDCPWSFDLPCALVHADTQRFLPVSVHPTANNNREFSKKPHDYFLAVRTQARDSAAPVVQNRCYYLLFASNSKSFLVKKKGICRSHGWILVRQPLPAAT